MRLHYTKPLETLPQIGQDRLLTEERPGVCVEPPGQARAFHRYAPEFIDDPGGTGLFEGLEADTYQSPPAFLTVLPQATLFGYRALAWDGRFCTDEAGTNPVDTSRFLRGLASPDPFPNEDTGLRPVAGDGTVFDLAVETRPQRHLDGTSVVLCSHEPSNFGSFLFRVLPKLHAVRQAGLQDLPVVVWAHHPAFIELLRLAGVPGGRIVQHYTEALTGLDRAIAPSLRNPHGFLDPESHALCQELARTHPGVGGGRRLYVSRLGQVRRGRATREMLNEAEVAAALVPLGFEVFEPEQLTPAEQIAAFASADIIVGPSGSAMFNVVFCRPGTKVLDIESEPHWIYAHTGLFASCRTRYGLFVGVVDDSDPAPVHRRFTVDVAALVARVARFVDSPDPQIGLAPPRARQSSPDTVPDTAAGMSFAHAEIAGARVQALGAHGPEHAGAAFVGGFVPDASAAQQRLRQCRGWSPVDAFAAPARYDVALAGSFRYGGLTFDHFGHAMSEMVHRILTTRQHFREGPWLFVGWPDDRPVSGFASLPVSMQVALAFLEVAPEDVVCLHAHARVERLLIAEQGSDLGGGPKPGYLALLRAHAERRLDALYPDGAPPRRIFVSRSKGSPGGGFLGERYIEQQLAREGFVIFHPQDHALSWQMEVYRRSEVLILPEGSACHGTELLGDGMVARCVFLERRRSHRGAFELALAGRSRAFQAWTGAAYLGSVSVHPGSEEVLEDDGVWAYDTDLLLAFLRDQGLARLPGFDKAAYVEAGRRDLETYLASHRVAGRPRLPYAAFLKVIDAWEALR